jgi:hypothetical protein
MVYLDDLPQCIQVHIPSKEVLLNELLNVNFQGQYSLAKATEAMVSNNNASLEEFHNFYGTNIFSFDQITFSCTIEFITNPEKPQDYFLTTIHYIEQAAWKQGMEKKYQSLIKNGTWSLVELFLKCKAIHCKWVYKLKLVVNGTIDHYKTHLVAKGYSQKSRVDYFETFSHVMKFDSIKIVLNLVVTCDMEILQFDIKTTFLYGEIFGKLYMN